MTEALNSQRKHLSYVFLMNRTLCCPELLLHWGRHVVCFPPVGTNRLFRFGAIQVKIFLVLLCGKESISFLSLSLLFLGVKKYILSCMTHLSIFTRN